MVCSEQPGLWKLCYLLCHSRCISQLCISRVQAPLCGEVSMAAVTCSPGRRGNQASGRLLILPNSEIVVLTIRTLSLSWPGIMKPMIQQDSIGGNSCRSEDQNCQAGQVERKAAPMDPVPVWGQESYASLQSKGYSLSHQKQSDNMTMEGLHARWVQISPILTHAMVGGCAVVRGHFPLKSRLRDDLQDVRQARILLW